MQERVYRRVCRRGVTGGFAGEGFAGEGLQEGLQETSHSPTLITLAVVQPEQVVMGGGAGGNVWEGWRWGVGGGRWGGGHSPTLITLAVVQPEQVVQALAAALLPLLVTEVIRVREDPEESNQAVQLSHPVLQGGAAQGPLVAAVQRKHRLGRAGAPVLDAVSLVQDDSPPRHLHPKILIDVQSFIFQGHPSIPGLSAQSHTLCSRENGSASASSPLLFLPFAFPAALLAKLL